MFSAKEHIYSQLCTYCFAVLFEVWWDTIGLLWQFSPVFPVNVPATNTGYRVMHSTTDLKQYRSCEQIVRRGEQERPGFTYLAHSLTGDTELPVLPHYRPWSSHSSLILFFPDTGCKQFSALQLISRLSGVLRRLLGCKVVDNLSIYSAPNCYFIFSSASCRQRRLRDVGHFNDHHHA